MSAWITTNFRSETLKMTVNCEILVPQPGYKSMLQTDNYRVIILLHGAHNDRTEWLLKSQIYDLVKEEPILVCMPSGKNSFYVNTATGYNYMDYITKELPEFLKLNFNVSEDRKDWLIAGESMGGYGALVCGLNATTQFAGIGAFSSALDICDEYTHLPTINMNWIFGEDWEKTKQSNYNLFEQYKRVPKEDRPRIFMCCGEQDRLLDMNKRFYECIKDEYDVVCTYGEGGHEFSYWNERLKEMLKWFAEVC